MTTVSETLQLPASVNPRAVTVHVFLAGEDGDPLPAGYATVAGNTIVGEHAINPDTLGIWSLALEPNDDITPSGTAWGVRLSGPADGRVGRASRFFDVPTSGGASRSVANGVLNGTTTITSATAALSSADVGATVVGSGIPDGAWITSVTNGTTAVLSEAATVSATGVSLTFQRPLDLLDLLTDPPGALEPPALTAAIAAAVAELQVDMAALTPRTAATDIAALGLRVLERDDFQRSDRQISGDTAPTGGPYTISGDPTKIVVNDDHLEINAVLNAVSIAYLEAPEEDVVTAVAAEFSLVNIVEGSRNAIIIGSTEDGFSEGSAQLALFVPDYDGVFRYEGFVVEDPIVNPPNTWTDGDLLADLEVGTRYFFKIERTGYNTLRAHLPDGQIVTATNPLIHTYFHGQMAGIQLRCDAGGPQGGAVQFHSWALGGGPEVSHHTGLPGVLHLSGDSSTSVVTDVTIPTSGVDLEITVIGLPDDDTPAASMPIIAQWASGTGQRGWRLSRTTVGKLSLAFTFDGTTINTVQSSVATPTGANGCKVWRIRSTGQVYFQYTIDSGLNWVNLGTFPVTSGASGTIWESTSPLQVGQAAGSAWTGSLSSAAVATSAGGTPLASLDTSYMWNGLTWRDPQLNVWRIEGTGFAWVLSSYDAAGAAAAVAAGLTLHVAGDAVAHHSNRIADDPIGRSVLTGDDVEENLDLADTRLATDTTNIAKRARITAETHTPVTVVNTASKTALAILATTTGLAEGDRLKFHAGGTITQHNGGAAVTYTFELVLGATTVWTSSAVSCADSANARSWCMDVDIALGASVSAQTFSGIGVVGNASTSGSFYSTATNVAAIRGSATENLGTTKNLVLSVTMSAADANSNCVLDEASLTRNPLG